MPQLQKISKNNTTVKNVKGEIVVTLHETEIVRISGNKITLDTGGWNTSTTRNRMNQVSNEYGLNFKVSSKAGRLCVTHGEHKAETSFFDQKITFIK